MGAGGVVSSSAGSVGSAVVTKSGISGVVAVSVVDGSGRTVVPGSGSASVTTVNAGVCVIMGGVGE